MKFGVVTFPGSNCDHDCYYAVKSVTGKPVEFIWHQDTSLDRWADKRSTVQDFGEGTSYAVFAHPRSPSWATLSAAIPGLKEADVVIVRPKPLPPVKVDSPRFFLLKAKQFWAKFDNNGAMVKAWAEKPAGRTDDVIDTIVMLLLPDGSAEPARMRFKTTKSGPAKVAAAAKEACQEPEWGETSASHKAALAAPYPWMRVVTSVTTKPRTSRGSGNAYVQAEGTAHPATPNDWLALEAFFKREDYEDVLDGLTAAHNDRLAEIEELIKKG